MSVVAFIIAVAAAFSGRRFWLRVRDDTGGGGFVGLTGMLLSAVFAFVIAVQVLPLFLGGGCA